MNDETAPLTGGSWSPPPPPVLGPSRRQIAEPGTWGAPTIARRAAGGWGADGPDLAGATGPVLAAAESTYAWAGSAERAYRSRCAQIEQAARRVAMEAIDVRARARDSGVARAWRFDAVAR